MKQFNVIVWDINSKKFVLYNVIPYLANKYKETKTKPKTFEEFKVFIDKESKYQWWSRCEYEIVLQSWPKGDIENKIDVYLQVKMNIDVITKLLMDEVNGTES